jgi:hypothetical protein
MNDLNWHPESDDPARKAGMEFSKRLPKQYDSAKTWLARQAFWCGVRWAREHHSLPISGRVLEDGKIEWNEAP